MDYEEFLTIVRTAAATDRESAERGTKATLLTLAERLTRGEARDLVAELPPELGPYLHTDGHPEPYDVEEFIQRIAKRMGTDEETAQRYAAVVLNAFRRAISAKAYHDVTSLLPHTFAELLPAGPWVEFMPADEFVRRVSVRADVDEEEAARTTEVVLELLGERIASGQVDDLIEHLDAPLRPPLRRGKQRNTTGRARPMPLDEFLETIAERLGVDFVEARGRGRAVFPTLREAVGDKEFTDTTSELPPSYDLLWIDPAPVEHPRRTHSTSRRGSEA
jgi:uncharacterized protein (DUF2267 family)